MYNVFLINHIEGNTLTYGQTELLDHMVYPANYKSMKPYIDIAEKAKNDAMDG